MTHLSLQQRRDTTLSAAMPRSPFYVPFLLAGMIITVSVLCPLCSPRDTSPGLQQLPLEQVAGQLVPLCLPSAAAPHFLVRTCNVSRIAVILTLETTYSMNSPFGRRSKCSVRPSLFHLHPHANLPPSGRNALSVFAFCILAPLSSDSHPLASLLS